MPPERRDPVGPEPSPRVLSSARGLIRMSGEKLTDHFCKYEISSKIFLSELPTICKERMLEYITGEMKKPGSKNAILETLFKVLSEDLHSRANPENSPETFNVMLSRHGDKNSLISGHKIIDFNFSNAKRSTDSWALKYLLSLETPGLIAHLKEFPGDLLFAEACIAQIVSVNQAKLTAEESKLQSAVIAIRSNQKKIRGSTRATILYFSSDKNPSVTFFGEDGSVNMKVTHVLSKTRST